MEPFKLFLTYGFAVDNNIFAESTMKTANFLGMMSTDELELCKMIGCLDSNLYQLDNFNFYNEINKHQNMRFLIKKYHTPHPELINCFRVKLLESTNDLVGA